MARLDDVVAPNRSGAVSRTRALHEPNGGPVVSPDAPPGPPPEEPDPQFWGPEPRRIGRADGGVRRGGRRRSRPQSRFEAWLGTIQEHFPGGRVEVGLGAMAVVVVALVAGVVWYRMSAAGGDSAPAARPVARASAERPARAPNTGAPSASVTPSTVARRAVRGGSVFVHVAGAVRTPGVLELPTGARVIDAVEGAGGALPDADLDRINLAAKIVDGQRILVVKAGAAPPSADNVGGTTGAATSATDAPLIDLNSATSAQLETIPGIGPALAGAIIAERDRRGGFRSVNELREVRGIGEKRFADLRERVTV